MNQLIKTILEKHDIKDQWTINIQDLNSAIIEICEEQKKECASAYDFMCPPPVILNSKNIAE